MSVVDIKSSFPDLYEDALISRIETEGSIKEINAGESIMEIGSYVKLIPLVLEGTIKVMREDEDGNELLLYYLHPGQTCAMSLNCCSANKPSEVRAVAEEDCLMVAIPADKVDPWLNEFTGWKNLVLNTYHDRFEELLKTIDSIAFMKMDERLLKYLESKKEALGSNEIKATHQQIADELNTSREVVSRLLKQLEKVGTITLGRNKISFV